MTSLFSIESFLPRSIHSRRQRSSLFEAFPRRRIISFEIGSQSMFTLRSRKLRNGSPDEVRLCTSSEAEAEQTFRFFVINKEDCELNCEKVLNVIYSLSSDRPRNFPNAELIYFPAEVRKIFIFVRNFSTDAWHLLTAFINKSPTFFL